jgi:PAS domain S-box-containing protein
MATRSAQNKTGTSDSPPEVGMAGVQGGNVDRNAAGAESSGQGPEAQGELGALRRENQRLKLLSEITSEVLMSSEPAKVVRSLCQKVLACLGCDVFFCYLVDEHRHRLHLDSWGGISEEAARGMEWVEIGEGICGCATGKDGCATGKDGCATGEGGRIVVENITVTSDSRVDRIKSLGVQACAYYPLVAQGQLLGALSFGAKVKPTFADDELTMMSVVADRLAAALHRAEVQKAVQQQKEFTRDILDTSSNLVFVKDEAGRFVMVNEAMAKLYGLSCDELVGHLNREMLSRGSDYEQYARVDREVLRTMRPAAVEETHRCADGRVIWFLTTKAPIRLPDDGMGVLGISVDITHRREAAEALRESRDRLTLAMAAAQAGLALWDLQTGKLEWNDQTFRIMGHEPNAFEPTYERWRAQVHPDDIVDAEARFWQCAQERRDFTHEHRIIWPNGEVRWVRLMSRLDYGPEGQAIRSTGVSMDITSLKEAEERMRRAKEEAQTVSQTKDQFLAVLSHELRTPLTPVLTSVQMMENDDDLTPEQRESLELVRRNVELEARLIDDLLDLTRISRGKLDLRFTNVDLHRKLQHVVGMCDQEITDKGLRLMVDLQARHHHVQADAARLQQILWNLLKNATKFTGEGGAITLRTRDMEEAEGVEGTKGGRVVLTVQDTGIGIEPARLPSIFDAFEQGGKEVTRKFGGLGLGLAISRELTDLHGGVLMAQSEGRGKGAVFTLVLPVSSVEVEDTPSARTPMEHHRAAGSHRILLVEDHADTAKVMARLLRHYGFEVQVANTMAAARQIAEGTRFDLLVSDIGLPDGNGWELMRQLQAEYPLKGIAMSGFGMDEDIQKSREAGFAVHLTKPLNLQRLEETVRELLG